MEQTPIHVAVDFDIPFRSDPMTASTFASAQALCNTAEYIESRGYPVDRGTLDATQATQAIGTALANPTLTLPIGQSQTTVVTAETIKQVLGHYNYDLLRHANQMRNMVIAKLLEQVDSPRNNMRALELLGKIPEVGLFTERVVLPENPNNRPDELRQKLKERLTQYINESTINAPARSVDVAEEARILRNKFANK